MLHVPSKNILFEMLRSFVTLAETLNLSRAVRQLNSTRQTVRRHIDILENSRGARLFELIDRQYCLTEAGKQSLKEAEIILARGEAWLKGQNHHINGLELVKRENDDGQLFHHQQHHLSRLWSDGTNLLKQGFACWASARGEIENSAFKEIRPFILVYRPIGNGWQCVEIGEKSVYTFWFGWRRAKSSVGHLVKDRIFGADFAKSISDTYQKVFDGGGVRLDHLQRISPRESEGTLYSATYQRLLFGGSFPDGEQALIVLTDLTNDIDIENRNLEHSIPMSASIMEEYRELTNIIPE